MAENLIVPDQLPIYVPGRMTMQGPEGWQGLAARAWRYGSSDVELPPMRDFMVVAYRRGIIGMRRRVDRKWSEETLRPGDVTLLTRAAPSHWIWSGDADVVHVYLARAELADIGRQMYDRELEEVHLRDEVRADDPAIFHTAMAIAAEAARGGESSQLLVDSMSIQLCVHILRRHAEVVFRQSGSGDGLTSAQLRTVADYVQTHLADPITLDDLAAAVSLSRFHFARRFREAAGTSPHEYVLRQRVERAKALIARTHTPLLDVAASCGFADQSHMTRVFNKYAGTTPGRYRTGR